MITKVSVKRAKLLEKDILKVLDNHSGPNTEICRLYVERLFDDLYNGYDRKANNKDETRTYDLRG